MRIRHDSTIRSDWLTLGLTRKQAQTFAGVLEGQLQSEGTISEREHTGRNYRDRDQVAVTAPSGWRAGHPGSHTVKLRGCSAFRTRARAVASVIAIEAGYPWDGRDLTAATDAMTTGEIDAQLLALNGQRGMVRIRTGMSFTGILTTEIEDGPIGQRIFAVVDGRRINLALVDRINPA
jgi:hypothetical protein